MTEKIPFGSLLPERLELSRVASKRLLIPRIAADTSR
jgi:hypothetical protein